MKIKVLIQKGLSILCLLGIIITSSTAYASHEVGQVSNTSSFYGARYLPAYFIYQDNNDSTVINNFDKQINPKNLNKKDIESILLSVLEQQNQNSNIFWNEEFVESYIKDEFSSIYNMIKEDNPSNYLIEVPIENNVSLFSDSMREEFSVTAYSLLGLRLYSLTSEADWTWNNSDVLTDVTIIRERVVGHDPIWPNGTIMSSSGSYSSNKKTYTHTVSGSIQSIIVGSESRPYLSYLLKSGRGYIQVKDPGN